MPKQKRPSPVAPAANPLQPIAYLVGGVWHARGEMPGAGRYRAKRTYRWMLGRNFIALDHEMQMKSGNVAVKGIIGWDAQQKKIVAWGFQNDGSVSVSQADPAGSPIIFTGERSGGTDPGPMRGALIQVNQNAFTETADEQENGK